MVQTIAIGVIAGYGALALAGGILGYVKAKSRASLIAGGASGLLLVGSAALATTSPAAGFTVASLISLALVGRFARSALAKRASPVTYVMVGGGLAVLVTAGIALA